MIAAYLGDPEAKRSQKTLDGYTVIFDLLEELIGNDRPVKTITRADCEGVRNVLMALLDGRK